MASPTLSSSIIPAPCSGTASSKIRLSGRSIRIAKPRPQRTSRRPAMHPGSSNALNAARSASPAKRARHCGFLPQRPPRSISFNDGDLAEVGRDRRPNRAVYDPALRNQWHAMFVQIGQERAYKPGWAKVQYKEKFGNWPPWGAEPDPIPPTPEVRSWVRSRMIAYAKRRAFA